MGATKAGYFYIRQVVGIRRLVAVLTGGGGGGLADQDCARNQVAFWRKQMIR